MSSSPTGTVLYDLRLPSPILGHRPRGSVVAHCTHPAELFIHTDRHTHDTHDTHIRCRTVRTRRPPPPALDASSEEKDRRRLADAEEDGYPVERVIKSPRTFSKTRSFHERSPRLYLPTTPLKFESPCGKFARSARNGSRCSFPKVC